ncbi:MAG: hypothetical protein LBN38_06575 [Verrucomicrobiota bacterium]|jgi:hypothetical protein|nr:hypothetical protein [Verrucomicrobiota bacterium]
MKIHKRTGSGRILNGILALLVLMGMNICVNAEEAVELGRGTYYQRVAQDRRDTVQKMIEVLNETDSTVVQKVEAIRVLGLYRAPEAIPTLIDKIGLPSRNILTAMLPLRELFPCLPALVNIGNLATQPLLERLGGPASGREERLLLLALCQIETLEYARLKLERSNSLDGQAEKRQRLLILLDTLP